MGETNEALQFFESLTADLDTEAPLQWSFLLDGASEDEVGALIDEIGKLGFSEIEPNESVEQEGEYSLWFAEVRVHTAASFAKRVADIEQFATREGLVVSDYAAGRVEDEP